MSRPLRVHHLLCTTLYQGEGYSEGFCTGMAAVVGRLRENPAQTIFPVSYPDDICAGCPHLTEKNTCDSNKNQVVHKDEQLAEILGLNVSREYTYEQLQKIIGKRLTEDDFQNICGDCHWYEVGLCSYEMLNKKLVR